MPVPISERRDQDGVGGVLNDVSPLDSIGHNVVEKIRRIEPELFWYEGNEAFLYKLAA